MAKAHITLTIALFMTAPLWALLPEAHALHDAASSPFDTPHGELPAPRAHASAAYVPTEGLVYVFGGEGADGASLGEVLAFDPTLSADPTALDVAFPARHGMAAVWDPATELVYLFGGVSAVVDPACEGLCRTAHDGVLAFDPATGETTEIVADSELQAPSTVGMAAAIADGIVHLFGGCTFAGDMCNDLVLEFDPASPALPEPVVDGLGPLVLDAGMSPSAVALPDRSILVVGAPVPDELEGSVSPAWRYVPSDTSVVELSPIPGGMSGAAGVLVDDRVYLLGGERDGATLDDHVVRYGFGAEGGGDVLILEAPGFAARAHAAHAWTGTAVFLFGGHDLEGVPTASIVEARPAPVLVDASADADAIRLTFDRPLLTRFPDASGFALDVNGIPFAVESAFLDDVGALILSFPPGLGSEDVATLSFAGAQGFGDPVDTHGSVPLVFDAFEIAIGTLPGDLPAPRAGAAVAWDGERALLFGGCEGCATSSLLAYAPDGATTTLASWAHASGVAVVATPAAIYLVGGEGSEGHSSAILRVDPADPAAEPALVGELPMGVAYASAVADASGVLYIIGGDTSCGSDCASAVYTLDPAAVTDGVPQADHLADLPLPWPRFGSAAAWLVTEECPDGCIYVLGGATRTLFLAEGEELGGADHLSDVLRIDPAATEPVQTIADVAFPARAFMSTIVVDGTILLLGGEETTESGTMLTSEALRFLPDSREVLTLPISLDAPRSGAALAWDPDAQRAYHFGAPTCDCAAPAVGLYDPDLAPPDIAYAMTPPANELGWHEAAVTVEWIPETGSVFGVSDDGETFVAESSYTFSSELATGDVRTVHLRERDASGNAATVQLTLHVDEVAPTLVAIDGPQAPLTGPDASVAFTFSEPMDPETTEAALTGADGWTRAWSEDAKTLTLTTTELPLGERTVGVGTGATDAHGLALAEAGSFTLTRVAGPTPPTVTVSGDHGEVGRSAEIVLTFSEPMDMASVEAALSGAEGWTRTWDELSQVLVLSHNDLGFGTHVLTLSAEATDAEGEALVEGVEIELRRERPSSGGSSDNDGGFLVADPPATEPTETPAEEEPLVEEPVEELPAEEPVLEEAVEEPAAPETAGSDTEEPLESTGRSSRGGTGGDSASGDADERETEQPEPTPEPTVATPVPGDEPPEPRILIVQPDGVDVSVDAGARGVVTVRLDGVEDPATLSIVLVSEDGTETILSEGQVETTWDTAESEDGFYTIEARRRASPPGPGEVAIASAHAEGVTLASARVLVRNPAPATTVAVATAGAVLLAAAAHAGLSAAAGATSSASASAAGGFDPLGFAQEVAIDAGQDKLRDKTKDKAALDRKRRIRSLVAAGVSLAVLAGLWALAEAEAWTLRAWLVALPVVGAAAALVTLMKYGAEGTLAWTTHARPRVRLWVAGTISLALSAVLFRNPFGYPGYVDETDESEARSTWRMQGLRGLATIAGATAFVLPFLALAAVLPWSFVGVGLLIAITNAATTAMPFGPLPGRDVWRWNKAAAVGVALAGFGLYVGYSAALLPLWSFGLIGVLGAVAYGGALLHFRRTLGPRKPREVQVPIARTIPVRTEEPAQEAPADGPSRRVRPEGKK